MSEEFVQFTFPCVDCIVRATCGDLSTMSHKDLLYGQEAAKCLTVPTLNGKSYHKVLIECMANLFKDIMVSVKKDEDPIGVNEENKIPQRYVTLFYQLTSAMQHMVNSTSWELGELQSFDRDEINRKLKVAKL